MYVHSYIYTYINLIIIYTCNYVHVHNYINKFCKYEEDEVKHRHIITLPHNKHTDIPIIIHMHIHIQTTDTHMIYTHTYIRTTGFYIEILLVGG